MDTDTSEQLAEMRKDINSRFAQLDQRVQGLDQRVQGLDQRMQGLDQRAHAFELDVAVIKSNYATKADVLAAKNSIIMWIIGAVVFTQLLPSVINALSR